MPFIAPFRGLRYDLRKVKSLERVVTPPYDVISPKNQCRYHRLHPYNFVRVVFGKEYASDTRQRNRYSRAKETLSAWIREGILRPDPKPSLYPHCQEYELDGRRWHRWGVIALVHLDSSNIYPHENVKSEPKADRLRLIEAVQAPLSPIFGLIPDSGRKYQRFIERACRSKRPVASVHVEGVRHLLWRVEDTSWIHRLKKMLDPKEMVIADGHHRFEAALHHRNLQKRSSAYDPKAPYNYAMFYLASSATDEPGLLATHRVLEGVSRTRLKGFLENLKTDGRIRPVKNLRQLTRHLGRLKSQGRLGIGLYTGNGSGYLVRPHPGSRFELGVEWLHQEILSGWMNGSMNLSYTPDLEEAVKKVHRGRYKILFLMQPPTLQDVLTRARRALRMPEKTTYFYPKPLAGLVEYSFRFP